MRDASSLTGPRRAVFALLTQHGAVEDDTALVEGLVVPGSEDAQRVRS
jgi:hypothetical protein